MIELLNKSPKLLIIGDLIIDRYLWGECERISPEAPVQIVNVQKENILLGGAGNVVSNLTSLGAKVDVISVIGNCNNSIMLKDLLSDIDVDTKYLINQQGRVTPQKNRIMASKQQVVRYDFEKTDEISISTQDAIIDIFKKIIMNYECVLLSDYGKGVLTEMVTKSLINIAKKYNKKILIDPKGTDYSKYKGAYLLTPNREEASAASKINIVDKTTLTKAINQLKSKCQLDVSLITMSEDGIAVHDEKFRIHPTSAREVFDVTGAGDTVLAALGYSLACNFDIDRAVKFSNLAAGIVVGKIGNSTTTINEIIEYESSLNRSNSCNHIKSLDEIISLTEEMRLKGKKIVFTNGCFDLLHAGHVKYLEASKILGDILIVGLNSDQSTTNLKGKDRPINLQDDRACILAALAVVDYVVIFDEETPHDLIKAIKPNILVKGSDYKDAKIIGSDIVDEITLIDFVEGKSTTKTIEKILHNL